MVEESIKALANNCGVQESGDLFSMELSTQLEDLKEDFMEWDDHSPERFMFVTLCKRSSYAVTEHWDLILEIMGVNCVH
jgi:hypothetical protein